MNVSQDEKRLLKRFSELGERAEVRGRPVYSEFLNLSEQTLLRAGDCGEYCLAGGWPSAERRLACFGAQGPEGAPIVCLEISPLSPKFAEPLGHRDVLGALMSLGIRRELLGDILLHAGSAYLFALDSIAPFIMSELSQIRRTAVKCRLTQAPPEEAMPMPEEREAVVASVRLDALVSAVWCLSRGEGQDLIAAGRAFINGRETLSASAVPEPGDIISLRGLGRFMFCGVARETKKGRLRVTVKVY